MQGRRAAGHGHPLFAADIGGEPRFEFRQRLAEGTRYFAATKRIENGLDLFFAEIRLVNCWPASGTTTAKVYSGLARAYRRDGD